MAEAAIVLNNKVRNIGENETARTKIYSSLSKATEVLFIIIIIISPKYWID